MKTKRIIPCLDIRDGRVVKGRKFEGIQDVEDPVALARFYNESGADELVFYDITASHEGRPLFINVLEKVRAEVSLPLTVGGSINSLEDFLRVIEVGADKVSVNSGAVADKNLVRQAAEKFGSSAVVLSMDVRRVDGDFRVFVKGGREDTGIDALDWAVIGEQSGAGELVVNSIDTDGVKQGFDIELLTAIADRVNIPIIASGGAGKKEDFLELFSHKGMSAGLAASIFHFREVEIRDLKKYLADNNIKVK